MGFVRVKVSFDGIKCMGCERESMENVASVGGDYCELFEVSKSPGVRCEACLTNEIRSEVHDE